MLVVTDTFGKVRDLLQERYGIDKVKVEMETELSSLGLDSLSLVECAFDLEESCRSHLRICRKNLALLAIWCSTSLGSAGRLLTAKAE